MANPIDLATLFREQIGGRRNQEIMELVEAGELTIEPADEVGQ